MVKKSANVVKALAEKLKSACKCEMGLWTEETPFLVRGGKQQGPHLTVRFTDFTFLLSLFVRWFRCLFYWYGATVGSGAFCVLCFSSHFQKDKLSFFNCCAVLLSLYLLNKIKQVSDISLLFSSFPLSPCA